MAETRKHQRVVRDALDQAIFTALGENVRPFTPGEDPYAAQTPTRDATEEDWVAPGHLPTTTTLAAISVTRLPRPDAPAATDD